MGMPSIAGSGLHPEPKRLRCIKPSYNTTHANQKDFQESKFVRLFPHFYRQKMVLPF
jgi:hypothetical protein